MSIRAALAEQTVKTKGRTDADIRRLAAECELRLASLESKIAELKLAVAPVEEDRPNDFKFRSVVESKATLGSSSLLQQRDRERITAAVLRHLVSPIRSLPVELLAEIFSLTIDKEADDFRNSHYTRHFRYAYRVSHVCSEWQQIALSTPQLWTGPVKVMVKEPVAFPVAQDARWTVSGTGPDADGLMIRAWLAHSDPLPVPVRLEGENLREGILAGPRNAFHPLLKELLRVAPRWGLLFLDGSLPPMFYQRLADCRLDSLEEAILAPNYFDDNRNTLFFVGNSPRLRKLNVVAHPSLHMPWAQLTELELGYGPASVSLDILAQCTSLVTLTLDGNDRLGDAGTGVTLPSLRVFNFTFRFEREARLSQLNLLSAPMLETCSISFKFADGPWTQSAFTAFLLRSPNITHLRLLWCPLTSNDLTTTLARVPSLTHLDLDCCYLLDNTFLLALHSHADNMTPPLVPLLHDFHFYYSASEVLTETHIVSMLTSRWSGGSATARWSRVALSHLSPFHTKDFTDGITELEHQGIPVEY
ncbi:hypothetical protein B0H16DRAFT_919467 [Mycena metata]|uniref:F-box domain-containing protein n=1 Tax=Mycena metata TaxID=1033252 RepID=A0AAD7DIV6_9AGAR|nr:hypothetical protein B0H16DRAFT_919467 [Mycena metata]